jgi:hypothetical protein
MNATLAPTADQLMTHARCGGLSKHALAMLLTPAARKEFFTACGRIEQQYTEACRAKDDPCLDSGCSMDGERCLQPLLNAGTDYTKAIGVEWTRLFADAANRDASWRVTIADDYVF